MLYSFGGGCIGGWYRQGGTLGSLVSDNIVGKGYAEAASTLNVFGTNCQDVTAAETMMMVKEHFIETYGPPLFTFGRGGSGGHINSFRSPDGIPDSWTASSPAQPSLKSLRPPSSSSTLNSSIATSILQGNR